MRYAVISDIHSNLEALDAVLNYLGDNPVDRIVSCGDITGYGPDPAACIKKVWSLSNFKSVIGNHDAAVAGKIDVSGFNIEAQAAIKMNAENLSDADKSRLASLKMSIKEDKLVFLHGSPRDPLHEYLYLLEKMKENIKYFRGDICFVGHTHQPLIYEYVSDKKDNFFEVRKDVEVFNFEPGARYIVNAGSVGQPRDNNPAACVVFFDTKNLTLTFRRIPYDVEKTQEKMRQAGYPGKLAARLGFGI